MSEEVNLQEILVNTGVIQPETQEAPAPAEAQAPALAGDSTPEPPQNMPSPEENPAPDHFERSWAAIKAAEKRNLEERNEVKAQRQEIDTMRQQLEQMKAENEQLRGQFKENPVEFLEKSGLTFDDLAKRVLNDGAASPEELIKRTQTQSQTEIQQLRDEIRSQREMIQEQSHERMIREYQGEIDLALKNEEFELLRDYPESETLIFNLASQYAQEHGTVLTPTDAARRVQESLIDQLKSLSKSAVVRKLLGAQEAPENPSTEKSTPSNSGQNKTKTLTNALSSEPPASVPSRSGMSEQQILMEAAKLINPSDWDNLL